MSLAQDVKNPEGEKPLQESARTPQYDVVIVGAGPYGLSIAAHLKERGLKIAIFGKPMDLWREHMPKGMYLRSRWWGSRLSDPHNKYSFERFFQEFPEHKGVYPLPIETFVEYGLWFQKNVVPNVDETYISSIQREGEQFLLELVDGRMLRSLTVVMAVGLQYYGNRPNEYDNMTAELVSHSFDHADFSCFTGKEVAVIGAGQSAIEYAALLHEVGARTHLVTRHPIQWLGRDTLELLSKGDPLDNRSIIKKLLAPAAAIAPGWKNLALEIFPYIYYRFTQEKKDNFMSVRYPPAASGWLRDRVIDKVTLHEGCKVQNVQAVDDHVELTLSSNETLSLDHVLLGTGYHVDVNRLTMIAPSLLSKLQTEQDVPLLSSSFECTVPGLFFVGNTTVRSFGPLYRHVVGTKAASRRISSVLARRVARARSK